MRRILLLLCLAFVLTGSSAAQTQVAFLAVGDYGIGGSGELAAGLVKDVLAGKPVEKANYVEDDSFTKEQAAAVIDSRKY